MRIEKMNKKEMYINKKVMDIFAVNSLIKKINDKGIEYQRNGISDYVLSMLYKNVTSEKIFKMENFIIDNELTDIAGSSFDDFLTIIEMYELDFFNLDEVCEGINDVFNFGDCIKSILKDELKSSCNAMYKRLKKINKLNNKGE